MHRDDAATGLRVARLRGANLIPVEKLVASNTLAVDRKSNKPSECIRYKGLDRDIMDTEFFPSFKARYHDPGRLCVGSVANVLLVHWMAAPLLHDVQRIRIESEGLLASYPAGISGIHVIEEGCAIAGAEARAATAAQIKALGKRLGCIAVVLLGRGFWASTLQALITSIAVFTRRETTIRFAASTEQLAGWFLDEHHRRTEQRLNQVRVDKAVAQLVAEARGLPPPEERPAQDP